jgi:hypothetical protein
MTCGFSPVHHGLVTDCAHWFILLGTVNLGQSVFSASMRDDR